MSSISYEREYFRKDGSRVAALVGAAVFEGNENEGVAFVLDLSEQKRAEEEMKQEVIRRRQAESGLNRALAEVRDLKNRFEAENIYLQEELRHEHNFEEMIGNSSKLLEVFRQVETVAPLDSTVLILGETGTGKELIARAIHDRSARKMGPLVKVNCGAIAAGLVESELFGHVKGAFTGAMTNRDGRFKLADGGTLFLDEIGELPVDIQVKILRVLQEQEFEPIGSSKTLRVNIRIIAATNRNLESAVRERRFPPRSFLPAQCFSSKASPLRERTGDVPLLVAFFLPKFNKKFGKKIHRITPETMHLLESYHWPGNIREMQNVVERAMILSNNSMLTLDAGFQLDAEFETPVPGGASRPLSPSNAEPVSMDEVTKNHIVRVLAQTHGVIDGSAGAAKILGLHPNTLRSRMRKLESFGTKFSSGFNDRIPAKCRGIPRHLVHTYVVGLTRRNAMDPILKNDFD